MAIPIRVGVQDFAKLRKGGYFYVDKTTDEQFFSARYANRGNLFEGLDAWKDAAFRASGYEGI